MSSAEPRLSSLRDDAAGDDPADAEAQRINLAWLIKLRWGAFAGQLLTVVLVDRVMHIALPLAALGAIIAIELASNFAFARWARQKPLVSESLIAAVMAADVVLFTVLLWLSGGAYNPFSFLYLVHIALATVVLRTRFTWSLVALSLLGFGELFLGPPPPGSEVAAHAHHHHGDSMGLHMQGMWVAFAVAAAFIVYFVGRVRAELAGRERELARARARAARGERLASLATLAAGAAHELSTPLATIAVAAKELERDLERGASGAPLSSDARTIRQSVDRCQAILARMAADAGQTSGEGFAHVSLGELLERALSALPSRERIEVALEPAARTQLFHAPPRATAQALQSAIENAQQATVQGGSVRISAEVRSGRCRIEIRDTGAGMSQAVLARAGEPFYTTKEPGSGMGLGLFLSRTVIERLGGTLELSSTPGAGTTAVIALPLLGARDNLPQAGSEQSVGAYGLRP